MANDISDSLVDAAQQPKQVTADGLTVIAQPLPDQIQADRYIRGLAITGGGWGAAVRPSRVIPPGAIGPGDREG